MDTVLIVDDSSFIVEGLIAFLKKKYRPIPAHGGAECLELLKRETPSVIILDIMMDPMDGWETLAHIKENPETRHIPVIMFSAIKISPEEAVEHQVSIDDCLTKPVSPNKIIEAIEKVLTRRDTHRMVVERWQSAGISQEKINKYLSLVTSLEVDLSLCQNMKVQYDLVPPKDNNHEEFHAVIRAVEERILQERDQIEAMAREMNEILARGTGIRDPAAPDRPSPEPGEPVPVLSSPTISGDENALRQGSSDTLPAVPVSQEPDTSRAIPEPEVPPVQDTPAASGAGPVPAGPDEIPGQVPSVPEEPVKDDAGETGSPPPVNGPAAYGEHGRTDPEQVTIPVTDEPAPALSGQEPAVIQERKVIPANLDLPPDTARKSSQNGAGTDVPMPWDKGRDRMSRAAMPQQAKKGELEKPDTPQPAPGFLARILSLVTSLFGRRT
ncbi:MAG: response regulator [Methanoregula sp.]|jgi:CheY-like chemotaxis protein/DNA-binding transcriptional MerR regulator|nr:response regulator [Methanoregula sp.]